MKNPKSKIRLYVPDDLAEGVVITLSKEQSHYAVRVMRQGKGDSAMLFNGRDGEWSAQVEEASKTACRIAVMKQVRGQADEVDIWLVFAPIKKARLDFLVEKATELGATRLVPVLTEHTDVTRVNVDRLSATAVEAAEQCERLSVPIVDAVAGLKNLLAEWPPDRHLFVMDETGRGKAVTEAFGGYSTVPDGSGAALLVGPEGGFSQEELDALRVLPFVTPVMLGPRVLRAETAALTALSCWQVLAGDGCEGRLR